MRNRFSAFYGALLAVGLAIFAAAAAAQIPANAARTIFLPQGPGSFSSPMNVAYHPGFGQYYASSGGSPSYQASIYNSSGTIVNSIEPINIDVRSWNYNPNTGQIEVVSFDAVSGGGGRGLIEAQLDGSGFYTGGTAQLLASMPGNASSQTMPAYDSGNNVFYSRDSGNTVNVVSRADGSLVSSINLDTATAGSGTLNSYAIGFSEPDGWLIVLDTTNNTAVIFDLAGAYVGTTALDITVRSSYGMGFANGQLFAWDASTNGWQGYDIGATPGGGPVTPPTPAGATPIPTTPLWSLVLLAGLLGLLGLVRRGNKLA